MRTKEEILGKRDKIDFFIKCRYNFKYFCEELLGFTSNGEEIEIQPFQERWVYLTQAHNRVVIEAATDLAKTETMGALFPLWEMFKNKNSRILLVSPTKDQTKGNLLDRIKNYIMDNEVLMEMFVPKDAETSWNQTEIKTKQGHWVKVVPYSTKIRGYRANIIVFDEFDDVDDSNIFFEHVLSRLFSGGKLVLTSTPKNNKGILAELKERKKAGRLDKYFFEKTQVLVGPGGKPAYDCPPENVTLEMMEGCTSIWEARHPTKEVFEKWHEQGKWNFMKNQMCEILGEEQDALFPFKYTIKSFDRTIGFSDAVDQEALYIIAADFATSEGPRADFDFYTVLEKKEGWYKVVHAEWWRGKNQEFKRDRLTELFNTYNNDMGALMIGDSSNAGRIFIDDLLARGLPIYDQKFNKVNRDTLIRTLSTVMKSGKLVIPRSDEDKAYEYSEIIKNQAGGFVRVKSEKTGMDIFKSTAPHDDGLISLSMAVTEATKYDTMFVEPMYGN